jgi:hypothetical protein
MDRTSLIIETKTDIFSLKHKDNNQSEGGNSVVNTKVSVEPEILVNSNNKNLKSS